MRNQSTTITHPLYSSICLWLFIGCLGSLRLENTCSRLPLIGRMISNISSACGDNGTMCLRLAFVSSAGTVYSFASRSISSHRGPDASASRANVNGWHSIKHRVDNGRLHIESERISLGRSSGRSVGLFCFFGLFKRHTSA